MPNSAERSPIKLSVLSKVMQQVGKAVASKPLLLALFSNYPLKKFSI
jgi:hypothetical protein